jgi:hypothetical protein
MVIKYKERGLVLRNSFIYANKWYMINHYDRVETNKFALEVEEVKTNLFNHIKRK